MISRGITEEDVLNIPFGEMKCVVYGIGAYEFDDEFILIFNDLLKEKETVAVFGLIEEKRCKVHQAFACDFLFWFNGKYNSFREVLIQEHISYPSRVKEPLNREIFMKKTEFLTTNNVRSTSLHTNDIAPKYVLDSRFNIYNLIGEGGVTHFFKPVIG